MKRPPPLSVLVATETLQAYQHQYDVLPLYDALVAYRDHGHPVGHFLTALLSKDLSEACGRADHHNLWLLPIYASFLYNEFPSEAWGSREKVAAWVNKHLEQRSPAPAVAP